MPHHGRYVAEIEAAEGWRVEAAQRYWLASSLRPHYVKAYHSLGNMLTGQGQHAAARAVLLHAVRLRPLDADLRNSLGASLHFQHRLDQAFAWYATSPVLLHSSIPRPPPPVPPTPPPHSSNPPIISLDMECLCSLTLRSTTGWPVRQLERLHSTAPLPMKLRPLDVNLDGSLMSTCAMRVTRSLISTRLL